MVKQWFRHALMLALLGASVPAATVLAQAPQPECTPRILNRADTMYNLERYDSTLVLLTPCLAQEGGAEKEDQERFSDEEDEVAAYRLVALSYFANQKFEVAKDWIRMLVRTHRDYTTNPDQDPLFFQEWIEQYRPKKWHQKTWVWVVGAATVGAVSFFLLRSKPSLPLDGPPPLPSSSSF